MPDAASLIRINREFQRATAPVFTAGTIQSADITRSEPLQRVRFGLYGAFTTAGSDGITNSIQGMFGLMENFSVIANGGTTLFSAPGDMLYPWSIVDARGGIPQRTNPGTGVGLQPYEINWTVDFSPDDYAALADYSVRSGGTGLRAEVIWAANRAACYTLGANASITDTTPPILTMLCEQLTDGPLHERGGHRGLSNDPYIQGQAPYRQNLYRRRNIETVTLNYQGAQVDLRHKLETGQFYNRCIIQTKGTSGVLSNSVLNGAKLVIGNQTLAALTARELRSRFKQRYDLDASTMTELTGHYVFDFADFWNEAQMDLTTNNFRLELDVANVSGAQVRVSSERYFDV